MNIMPKNVWTLTIAQALMMSMNSLNVFVGGLVGNEMAPDPKLATLPVASIVVGTALSTVPVAAMMKHLGRKWTFLLVAVYSVLIALLAAYAIYLQEFYFFVICTFLLGLNAATLLQYRFAAMESVPGALIPKAASYVLLGGVASAFIGPEVAIAGKDLFAIAFVGSYVLLAGIFVLAGLVLLGYENNQITPHLESGEQRSLIEICRNPVFWVAVIGATVGYAVMTFIMTATPVSMHVMDGINLSDTKWTIQSHIVAMFVPSIITGWLIEKLGIAKMMIAGLLIYLVCIVVAYSGHGFHHYFGALLLLGVGWNFLFVGGTALLPQAYRTTERYKVQGLNELIVFSVQAVAGLSAGWVVFSLGWERLLLMTLPLILIQFGVILFWLKKKGKNS